MSAEGSEEPVRIRCAADLFAVLTSGPVEAKLAVLQSIVEDPKRPLALGCHQGEDLVSLLLRLIPESTGVEKQLQILCLMSYQDPRSTEFMVEEFSRSRDAGTVLRLGRRLTIERGVDFFRPFLWHAPPAQALAAARLCSLSQDLSPAERLRVAILLDSNDYQPPRLGQDTMELWLQELAGKHRLRARALAERSGQEMLEFWKRWPDLPHEEQLWLARQTARLDLGLLQQRLAELLKDPTVAYAYVELAGQHGVELSPSLLDSDQPLVRAAAIQSGLADARVERYLGPEATLPEVLAAAPRWSIESLLGLLGDSRWQVRALATDLLARASDPPLEALRIRALSESLGEKVAAVEVLQRLGHQEWLEEHVLRSSPTTDPILRSLK